MISEVSPMKGASGAINTGEFVELYNPRPTDVVFSAADQVVSGNTSGTNAAEWQLSLAGKTIKAFGFLLIGDGGVVGADLSFPSSKNLANSGIRSCVQLRNGSTVIDAFGWDPLLAPTLVAEGKSFTPSTTSSDGKSFERKSSSTATGPDLLGNAWDTGNNATDFFENAAANANPQNSASPIEIHPYSTGGDGSGGARISPTSIMIGDTCTVVISAAGDGSSTLDSLVVVIPSGWTWGRTSAGVTLSGTGLAAAQVTVVSDTIFVGGTAVTKTDSAIIRIARLVAPATTGSSSFILKTAIKNGVPKQITSSLTIGVTKLTRIIELHINDSQGVPRAPYQVGATVTVSGIITADLNPAKTDIYVQDETAGVDVYSASRFYAYQPGDSITVTGAIVQFRGLVEIAPDSAKMIIHSHGRPVPEPMLLLASDVNRTFNTDDYSEPNESRLVRVNNVTYSSTNSTITDASGTAATYIDTTYLKAPTGTFDLVGVIKQYKPGSVPAAPFTADYEVVPRAQSDIILHPGPIMVSSPVETNLLPNSVTISFRVQTPAAAVVKYGTSLPYTDSVAVSTPATLHNIVLSGLQPATVYHYQVGPRDSSGTNFSGDALFITASPAASTGMMNVYFTRSTNSSVSLGENAQTVNPSDKLIARINAAQHTIDLALYSLSGTVGSNIATALLAARARGLSIRAIVEYDNSTAAPITALKNGGVPLITDYYDPGNGGLGLMHNKFVVFDGRDRISAADDWVWTGSWNATDQGTNNDAQNVIEIQDQALAIAYTIEFDEMWGSATESPNAANSRFGIRKKDNTPHRFSIAGTPVESYFSPSDRTTAHILSELNAANSSINISILSFTRDELAQALIAKKNEGKKVRVALDNNTDSGNEYAVLLAAGVDIVLKPSSYGGLLHHKYAIIDADRPAETNTVVTGSHNWSGAAETSNNENTLVIRSRRIANLYLQEFKQRYAELGGKDPIAVSVLKQGNILPEAFALSQNFPNPFNPATTITFSLPTARFVTLKIFDVLGKEIAALIEKKMAAGRYAVQWDASSVANGMYLYQLKAGEYTATKKLVLLR
ncbi:MAG: phospholipase D-like domain-containing protein [Ignavibacteriales bacterium]|nr:phospholipase D-like domain-containing protein [Ignavibacteriales bacterium]